MAADCSFLHLSMAFTMVCAPYCSSDRSLDRLFFCTYAALPTVCMLYSTTQGKSAHLWVRSYHLRVDDFSKVLRVADSSPYCLFFHLSTSSIPGQFTYRVPQRMAADCSVLHLSTACTMVFMPYCSADGYADRSFVHSSTAYMVCTPYCFADGNGLLILPLVNPFYDGLHAVLLCRWLGRSFIRSLVNGFHNGLRAVLLST